MNKMNKMARYLISVSFLVLSGCAVHQPYPFGMLGKKDVNLAYSPVGEHAEVSSYKDIHSLPKGVLMDEDKKIQAELAAVQSDVNTWLKQSMASQTMISHQAVNDTWQDIVSGVKASDADLFLEVDITEYGHIRKKWIALMAGTGFIEGVAQGVMVSKATGNQTLGLAVGAEEVLSESVVAFLGPYLWSRFLSPVILEGRMWRVDTGKLIWKDVEFSDSSDLMDILFADEPPKKEDMLQASMQTSETALLKNLNRYIQQQVLYPQKGHR